MKLYIIAGEASGDLHGSNLIKELKDQKPDLKIRCWGGDRMEAAGADLVKHYRDLAFMGFVEVVANLRTILKNIKMCKEDIQAYKPDAVVLIDYPGFNLRIARFAKELGIPVIYYISPQIWAWKESRVSQIKRDVDHMMVILPFEKSFYQKHNYEVDFVGHPLLDAIDLDQPDNNASSSFRSENGLTEDPIIALAPGSRKQEISKMLPIMISVKEYFPQYQFVIAGAPSADVRIYSDIVGDDIPVLFDKTYDLFRYSEAGLITSGTATLEAALHNLPIVVCYKGGAISYAIARQLVKVPFISLVNLIGEKEMVTELIQNDLNTFRLKEELDQLLNPEHRDRVLVDYENLRTRLGGKGASQNAAKSVLKILSKA